MWNGKYPHWYSFSWARSGLCLHGEEVHGSLWTRVLSGHWIAVCTLLFSMLHGLQAFHCKTRTWFLSLDCLIKPVIKIIGVSACIPQSAWVHLQPGGTIPVNVQLPFFPAWCLPPPWELASSLQARVTWRGSLCRTLSQGAGSSGVWGGVGCEKSGWKCTLASGRIFPRYGPHSFSNSPW